jgi:hypothetical protein
MSKNKSAHKNAPTATKTQRWSIGLFKSSANGDPIVTYCRISGEVVPYMAKRVTTKKASAHGVFTDMSYAHARAQLLKQAGLKRGQKKPAAKKSTAAKQPVAKEEHLRKAA